MMNNRSKRQSQQIQTTVKMKLAVLEKQKQDILDIIDDYAGEVVKAAEYLLSSQPVPGQSLALYSTILQKLDKTSELFTKIAIIMDSILYDQRQAESPESKEQKVQPSSNNPCVDKNFKTLATDEDGIFSKIDTVNRESCEKQFLSKPFLLDPSQSSKNLPHQFGNQEMNLGSAFESNQTDEDNAKSNATTLGPQLQGLTGSFSSSTPMSELQNAVTTDSGDDHFQLPHETRPHAALKYSSPSSLTMCLKNVSSEDSAPLQKSNSQNMLPPLATNDPPFNVKAPPCTRQFSQNNNSLVLSEVLKTGQEAKIDERGGLNVPPIYTKPFMLNKGSSVQRNSFKQAPSDFHQFLGGRKRTSFKTNLDQVVHEVRNESLSQAAVQKVSISEWLVQKDDILAVAISDVDHPWSFHVQLQRIFDDEMEEKIGKLISNGKMENVVPCQGLFCLAKFKDSKFYRAKILSVQENEDKVKVIYVDYGNSLTISVNDVFVLPKDLATYPANNLFCALSGASPKNSEFMWPEEAILYFQQYANEQVQIRIVSLHSGKDDPSLPHIVDAILKNQSISSPQSLAAILIEKDLAKTIKLKDLERALTRQYCPSHDSKLNGNPNCSDSNVNFNGQLNGSGALVNKDIKSQPLHENQRGVVKTLSSLSPQPKSNNFETNNANEWQRNKDIEKCFELGHNLLLSRGAALYRSENKDENMAVPIVLPDIEIQVMFSNVVSPSSFFVHCATEETGKTLEVIREKMMTLSKSELRLRSKNFNPIKNSLCCAICSVDGQLYRGLVLETYQEPADAQNHENRKVLIFFIDYGDFEWVSHSNVFHLPEELKKIRPMVLWCTLANIKPQLHNSESVTKQHTQPGWPSHVVEEFRAMICTQDILYTMITENSSLKITECDGFQLEPLPIYLLDRSGPQEMCLNYELIELGLAAVNNSCQIPAGGDSVMPDSYTAKSSEFAEWDPMFEEYTSLRNSYKVDIDDAGVALVGYSAAQGAKDGKRVCAYFNKSSGCKRGVNCPNLHVKVQDADTTYDKVAVLMFDEDQTLLLPQPGSYCNVTVTNVKSPSQFYVNLHDNSNLVEARLEEESLNGLMANMQKYYKTSIYYDGDLTLLAPGQAVAAKIRGIWMRAKVIDTDVEGCLVQVMSVDYGNLEWVNERDIRELQLQFIHLTPQAVECALSDFVPKDEFEGWTGIACTAFAKLVMGKAIVLQVKYRYPTGLIGVSLYDSSRNDIRESLLDYGLISNSIRNSEMETVSQQFSDKLGDFLYMPG